MVVVREFTPLPIGVTSYGWRAAHPRFSGSPARPGLARPVEVDRLAARDRGALNPTSLISRTCRGSR